MTLSRLKLSQLRTLVAIAECGNFSEAALDLEVTQSTVSHAIATLEEELGVMLLQRGRYGAQLTPVGAAITDHARQLLQLVEAIGQEAERAKGVQGGTVRIASFRSVATHVLPGAIARLHSRYPNVSITITEVDELSQLQRALQLGQVDVCVAETLVGEEFESIHIFDDEYVALLPPETGLRNAKLSLEDLSRYPLITSSHSSCGSRIHRQLQQLNDNSLKIAYRIRHDSSMVGMVRQGLGVAILPRLAAEPVPADVRICALPFALSRPIGATVLKSALHTPAVFAFLEALQQSSGPSPLDTMTAI
jgi:molybdate transport repressor ModE-like protein